MQVDRYQRHTLIDWFSQDDVRRSRIAVIGAGAIGNEIMKNLALLGVGAIDIFDFDHVEEHNLTRSVLFRDTDIGRTKAACAAERARELDPSVEIRAIDGDVWKTLTLAALPSYGCVVCAVDNFEARIRVNQLCRLARVDMVNAAIDSRYASIEVFPFRSKSDCPCYECNLPSSVYGRIAERYSCGWLRRVGYTERKVPTTIITSAAAGALATSAALRLGHTDQPATARRQLVDTIAGQSTTSELVRQLECVGCSHLREQVEIVRPRGSVQSVLVQWLPQLAETTVIRLSDQMITGLRCIICGGEEQRHFELAERRDESLTICPRCEQRSVIVTIRDTFTIAELLVLFGTGELTSKYALMDAGNSTVVFDLDRTN
jgi:molybdopterin/thiamine biosynthesis adenylyltransferase